MKIHEELILKIILSLEISCTVLTSKIKFCSYRNLEICAIFLENLCTHDLYCEIMCIQILVVAYVENQ